MTFPSSPFFGTSGAEKSSHFDCIFSFPSFQLQLLPYFLFLFKRPFVPFSFSSFREKRQPEVVGCQTEGERSETLPPPPPSFLPLCFGWQIKDGLKDIRVCGGEREGGLSFSFAKLLPTILLVPSTLPTYILFFC